MNARTSWVDYGKGIGIILVVYAHLLSSAFHAGIQVPAHFFELSDSMVYSFHMPLFFFLCGLFVEGSFEKRGAKDYLLDKFSRIAYPYLLWSVLQVSVEIFFSGQSQQGAAIHDLFAIAYRPWGQFWFLYALLLMYIAYAVFSIFGKYAALLTFSAAIALYFYPLQINLFGIFGFSTHFIFFAGGVIFKNQIMQLDKYDRPLWVVVLLMAGLMGSGYFIFENLITPIRLVESAHLLYFLYLSVFGIIACSVLSQYLASRNIAQFLQLLGRHSLQIYLVHMLAGVGMRIILLNVFGIQNWIVHILLGVLFALAAGIILQQISNKLNFPYLFDLRRRAL